jgi:ABC-type transport system substrate-binding protein
VYDWFHGSNGNPSGGRPPLKDAEIDRLLDQGRMLPDGAERAALYKALQLRMLEVSPNIWLHNRTTFEATNKRLQGYEPTGMNTPALAFVKSFIAA